MSDDPLSRLRESLQRSSSGDPTARQELEESLRELSCGQYRELLARWQQARSCGEPVSAPERGDEVTPDGPTVKELIQFVEGARACLTATGPAREAPPVKLPGVPGYELLEVLGRGGMGVVYKARQLGFNRVVALKMIRAGDGAGPSELARFRVEAEAVARVRHPNIVQVHDIGETDGCPYFSMEFLPGGSLAKRVRAEPLPPRRAAELVEALARAMQHAHEAGVVHRDLKPSNVLLDGDGTPKVTDFGLAKLLDTDATQTASEAVLGTACYMAPEQATGGSRGVGPATDVYGLGAILYDLLTGRPPVERGSWPTMLRQILDHDPPDPSRLRPEVDRDLEAVCLKCLRKEPGCRYASAGELADDLRRWLDGRPTAARPLGWAGRLGRLARRRPLAAAAAVLVLLVAVAAPFAARHLDAERVPKGLLARVARGETATLIGPAGPPAWSRQLVGQPEILATPPDDGTFTISSLNLACVELLPATPARGYRFHVELRHIVGHPAGRVGIYFGHRRFPTPTGTEHCFCAFAFDDRQGVRLLPDGTRQNRAELEMWRVFPDGTTARPGAAVVKRFRPAADGDPARRPWRVLDFVVTGGRVSVSWDGELVGEAAGSEMVKKFQDGANPPDDAARYEPGLTPSFGPGGGLGLLVEGGQVSVKNVFVRPVDGAKSEK